MRSALIPMCKSKFPHEIAHALRIQLLDIDIKLFSYHYSTGSIGNVSSEDQRLFI
jgi:hypothetical protein